MDPMCRELTGILPYPKPYSSQTDTERETGVEFMAHQLRGILCWNKTCPAPDAYIRCMLYFSPDMRNNVQLQKFMFHLIFRPKIDGFSGKARVDGMGGLIHQVADYQNHRNALGYSFRYYVQTMLSNTDVKLLKINGIEPSRENIANHTYPLADTFFAVTRKGQETENTKRLIEWILSDQGQRIIEKTGYVRLKE